MLPDVVFDWVSLEDLNTAIEIEQEGYPPDEAASPEAFRFRQSEAGDLFLGAFSTTSGNRELLAYVCSTLSPSTTLTHESMTTHVAGSSSVCIHSVCVSSTHRREGLGLRLLKEYISRLVKSKESGKPYERVLLVSHEELIRFYQKAGFQLLGKSDLVHGSQPWYSLQLVLPTTTTEPDLALKDSPEQSSQTQQLPPGLFEALQRRTPQQQKPQLISEFANGISDVTTVISGLPVNKFDLVCPKNGCGSVILKKHVAKSTERTSPQIDLPGIPINPILPAIPPPPATPEWWLITPSPMEFENIGFSRPVTQDSSVPKLKLLSCAECDLGPLGWSEEGGSQFWLAISRVGYRD